MPKILKPTTAVYEFSKLQMQIFQEKVGIHFDYIFMDGFIDLMHSTAQGQLDNNKEPEKYNDRIDMGFLIDNSFNKAQKEVLYPKLKEICEGEKFDDKKFTSFMNAYIDMINKINMYYKVQNNNEIKKGKDYDNISTQMTEVNLNGCVSSEDYKDLYADITGKKATVYETYKDEVAAVKSGKSDKMCGDMNNALESNDLDKAAIIYKQLEEKQKKNSIFTNWFSRKGYQERKAMKAAKAKIEEKINSTYSGDFDKFIKNASKKGVSVCDKFHTNKEKLKVGSMNFPNKHASLEYVKAVIDSKDLFGFITKEMDEIKSLKSETGSKIKVDLNEKVEQIDTNIEKEDKSNKLEKELEH